jgi:hypothetical protein
VARRAKQTPPDIETLAADPVTPDVLFAGGEGLYISRDDGTTWDVVPELRDVAYTASRSVAGIKVA